MAMTTDTLTKDVDEQGICVVTLNRPEAMNAINGELLDFLWHTFYELHHDEAVRVVILTGAGEKAFCAGADLKERRGMSEALVRKRLDDCGHCFRAVEQVSKPVICAINGYAFGGGLELALACDLRVMAKETKVGLTELGLGIIPGAGGTQRLPRLIGLGRAKELIFTAAKVDAQRALAMGLVNDIAPRRDLMTRARELAQAMLGCGPIALAQAKLAINAGMQTDLETGLTLESRAYAVTLPTTDRLEGLEAFKEGRAPRFTGH